VRCVRRRLLLLIGDFTGTIFVAMERLVQWNGLLPQSHGGTEDDTEMRLICGGGFKMEMF